MLPLLSNTRTTSATKLQAGALGGDGGLADTLAANAATMINLRRAFDGPPGACWRKGVGALVAGSA